MPANLRLSSARLVVLLIVIGGAALPARVVAAQEPPPSLTAPVNDFAGVIDPTSEQRLDALIRSLQQASGDVIVVAAIETFAPYGDIREYAVKMFENRGRGIGQKGRDNGLLVVMAVRDRNVAIEVGYDLEEFITDGFAGETIRLVMTPEFRRGNYGAGLLAGVSRLAARIAQARNVELQDVPVPVQRRGSPGDSGGGGVILALFVLFLVLNGIAGRVGRRRRFGRGRWGVGPWSGWHSGVGPFGGGFGGGFRGGGFGGGFGGFGGGRSGGGGASGSW